MGPVGIEPTTYRLTYRHLVSQATILWLVGLDYIITHDIIRLGVWRVVSEDPIE